MMDEIKKIGENKDKKPEAAAPEFAAQGAQAPPPPPPPPQIEGPKEALQLSPEAQKIQELEK